MIRHIALSNFKAFGQEQQIPLRPITLIFGKNSSGKSSIIHSLLLAHHVKQREDMLLTNHVQQKENWQAGNLKLSGESVDLGTFYNYVHRQDTRNEVALKLECDVLPKARRHPMLAATKRLRLSLHVSAEGYERRDNDAEKRLPKLMRCNVEIDGQLLLRLAREENDPDRELQIKHWNDDHPLSQNYVQACLKTASVSEASVEIMTTAQQGMKEHLTSAVFGEVSFFPSRVTFPDELSIYDADLTPAWHAATDPVERLSSLISQQFPRYMGGLFAELHHSIADHLNRIEYLGPLRILPPRFLPETDSNDPNWKSGGAFAWKQLMSDQKLLEKVNLVFRKLGVRYDLEVRGLADEVSVQNATKKYIDDFFLPRTIQQLADRENDGDQTLAEEVQLTREAYAEYLRSNSELHDEMAARLLALEKVASLEEGKEVAFSYIWEEEEWKELQLQYPEGNPAIRAVQADFDTEGAVDSMWRETRHLLTDTRKELKLVDRLNGTLVTHRDVGIGISQMLPVLVHAVASENKLIAIEQPEIHLHPAMQAELGDVFIESALGQSGNQFIIETHSEHLILRIMRRIRETFENKLPERMPPITSDYVSILYVEPGENGSIIREMPLNERGELVKGWPGGFFEEALNEM